MAVAAGALLVLAAAAAVLCSSATGDDVFGAAQSTGIGHGRPVVPAVYVFGDSLVDAGNNDFLPPPAPRAVPPNGVDLPRTVLRRTGRFTNGYNLADITAPGIQDEPTRLPLTDTVIKLRSPTRPRWCQLCIWWIWHPGHHWERIGHPPEQTSPDVRRDQGNDHSNWPGGSGDAGRPADPVPVPHQHRRQRLRRLRQRCAPEPGARVHRRHGRRLPQAYQDQQVHVQELYELGARRLALLDMLPVGCLPSQRAITANGECDTNGNSMSQMFNALLRTEIAKAVVTSMPSLKYSIASLYNTYTDMIANPALAGFHEVKRGCCGSGKFNGEVPCTVISNLCANRDEYLFWDMVHGTQAAYRWAVLAFFYGPTRDAEPINLAQLMQEPLSMVEAPYSST
ncbi:GDSL esterase/lipase At4g28780 isoform X2 [Setaria italica]|uniref:GDSL esterase/lipase At4g28780 isoform X2 n=1 Tax=Setaria italica TaxID=4555 RepID=UPI000350A2C6|nr:GDSL esterase/lipase At4g28780 isoform X2 [Setaria italica]XP_034588767.1 GDSL esterase/lipase At4g28780-like isoform X2 [Setaria viridis]